MIHLAAQRGRFPIRPQIAGAYARHVRIAGATRPRGRTGTVGCVRRILLRPSWIARHALALALIGLFLRMGIWQWTKGESDHGSMQNLFYGVEWPIFAAFVAYWWWRMVSEDLHPRDAEEDSGPQWGLGGRIAPEAPAPSVDGSVAGATGAAGAAVPATVPHQGTAGAVTVTPLPQVRPGQVSAVAPEAETEEDLELAAYNRYLASLYERDATGPDNDRKGGRR